MDSKFSLFIVADGMGGHRGGEVASAMAVETMQSIFEERIESGQPFSPREMITSAYREASRRISLRFSSERPTN